jgi:hypothetical protein
MHKAISFDQTEALFKRALELHREARDIDATIRPTLFLFAAILASCEAWHKSGRNPGKHPFVDLACERKDLLQIMHQAMIGMRAGEDVHRALEHCIPYVISVAETWKEIKNAPHAAD